MRKVNVLNVCLDDYANYSYDNCQALINVGINAFSVKSIRHPFGYKNQSPVADKERIKFLIDKADIVQFMHSDHRFLEYAVSKNKCIIVYHTGTIYRNDKERINAIFNPHIALGFTDQTEFMGTGIKNEQYIATCISPKSTPIMAKKPFKFAHYPSNPEVKGTKEIIEMMNNAGLSKQFVCSTSKVSHSDQIKRMMDCDVYIELFKPILNGRPYGCYGVTAFEAAAIGKVVVTNNIRPDVYHNAYGHCPFMIANDSESFIRVIKGLSTLTIDEMKRLRQKTFSWVNSTHSYQATGERLRNLLQI